MPARRVADRAYATGIQPVSGCLLNRPADRIYGRGTGDRYFKNAYAKHLDRELAGRLQPLLERKAVASAEPGVEKAERSESVAAQ